MTYTPAAVPLSTVVAVWLASILLLIIVAVLAVPMTFFLMLFLGNIGIHLSFVACIPGGLILSTIRTRIGSAIKSEH